MGVAKRGRVGVAPFDQSRAVGDGRVVVVCGVAFRLAQHLPVGEHRRCYAATARGRIGAVAS